MTRVPFWEDRLYAAIEKHRNLPHDYVQSDCFRLMMDALEAVTGSNPYADDMNKYDSSMGAAKLMVSRGLAGIGHVIEVLGYPDIPHSKAMRGDLAILAQTASYVLESGDKAGGVVTIGGIVAKGERGLLLVPMGPEHTYYAVR